MKNERTSTSTSTRTVLFAVSVAVVSALIGIVMLTGSSSRASAAAASDASSTDQQPSVAVETVSVQRGEIGQPVHAYGVVAAGTGNVTSISLPYVAKVEQVRVQPGQRVTRGTPLVVVQADASAVVAAEQAKSAVTLAQGELDRTKALFEQALATRSQLATAQKALSDAQQNDAAQAKLGIAGGTKTIVSPVDGVVLQIASAQGDQVAAGTAMMQLAGTGSEGQQRANVMLGIEPADAVSVHAGDLVAVRGLSTALAAHPAEGHVVLVGAAVDPQSQLVDVGASAMLAQTQLIPGTHVEADITTRSGTHWIVPRDAVLQDDHGSCVYQVEAGNKARRVPVTVSVESGDRYGVDGALNAKAPLVLAGNYELTDGMAVRVDGAASAGSAKQ